MLASPARQGAGPPQAMGGAGPYGGGGGFAGGPGGQRGMFSGRVTTQQVGAGRLGAGVARFACCAAACCAPSALCMLRWLVGSVAFLLLCPTYPSHGRPPARKPAIFTGAPTHTPTHHDHHTTHTLLFPRNRACLPQDKLLEGKVITIKKGPYRGMRGRVITASGTHVRLELEAQVRTLSTCTQGNDSTGR